MNSRLNTDGTSLLAEDCGPRESSAWEPKHGQLASEAVYFLKPLAQPDRKVFAEASIVDEVGAGRGGLE